MSAFNDRELLELAAKALLNSLRWDVSKHVPLDDDGVPLDWNPLTDDGDALRLAVTLQMSTHATSHGTVVYVMIERDGEWCRLQVDEPWIPGDGTEMAATRRAITRAAAEIAGTLP